MNLFWLKMMENYKLMDLNGELYAGDGDHRTAKQQVRRMSHSICILRHRRMRGNDWRKPGTRRFQACLIFCLGCFFPGLGQAVAHVANMVMRLKNAFCLALDDGAHVTGKLAGERLLI